MTTTIPGQEALLNAARVKFTGMSLDELSDPPELDQQMTFLVRATCTGRGTQRMKDGEIRHVATMTVESLEPQGAAVDKPAPPNLFEDDEDEDGTAA